jgi:hypothetical protein
VKKVLFVIVGVVVLLVGTVVAVGFIADPKFDQRNMVVVNAPVERVFAVVADPTRCKDWMPQDIMPVESTELKAKGAAEKAAGAALNAALGSAANGANAATHVYHHKDGKTLEMQTVRIVPMKEVRERIVGGDAMIVGFFDEMTWGFEMQPAKDDPKKTELTCFAEGRSKKPVANFMNHLFEKLGVPRKHAEEMAHGVEQAANATPAPAAPKK